ncbi:MAG: UPF0280 family protein [Bacteroidota bacterium]
MNSERFRFFSSVFRESDLLIGVPHKDFHPDMPALSRKEQIRLYKLLSDHDASHPGFMSSLEPLPVPDGLPGFSPELELMYKCGIQSGTGPMSAVAGLFAEAVARKLDASFGISEMVVENGGDLYIRNGSDLLSVIYAGSSALSEKLALLIPGGKWGVCTSSGTLGHSFSRGKADALTVVARSTPMADAWATALANQVRDLSDIEPVLERIAHIPEILTCVVIVGDRVGVRGELEVKLLS